MDPASKNERNDKSGSPLIDALFGLGSSWAARGLDAGKLSLENSAKILTRTAKTLETLAREIEQNAEQKTRDRS